MEYELKNLFIDFRKCPRSKRLVDFFANLSVWPEFTECKNEEIIRIAILTGDIESDFVSISDRNQMLRSIFEYLKIDMKKNKNLFESIEKYTNEDYMRAWFRYMYISNEMEFALWLTLKSDYSLLLESATKPAAKDISQTDLRHLMQSKKLMREQLTSIINEIKEIEAKLFPDSRAARQMVNTERKIRVYAEKYAEEGTYL